MPVNEREELRAFGERLRRLRESRGLSKAVVARAAEVTSTAILKWEAGGASPASVSLRRLADLFGVTMDFLWRGPDPLEFSHAG